MENEKIKNLTTFEFNIFKKVFDNLKLDGTDESFPNWEKGVQFHIDNTLKKLGITTNKMFEADDGGKYSESSMKKQYKGKSLKVNSLISRIESMLEPKLNEEQERYINELKENLLKYPMQVKVEEDIALHKLKTTDNIECTYIINEFLNKIKNGEIRAIRGGNTFKKDLERTASEVFASKNVNDLHTMILDVMYCNIHDTEKDYDATICNSVFKLTIIFNLFKDYIKQEIISNLQSNKFEIRNDYLEISEYQTIEEEDLPNRMAIVTGFIADTVNELYTNKTNNKLETIFSNCNILDDFKFVIYKNAMLVEELPKILSFDKTDWIFTKYSFFIMRDLAYVPFINYFIELIKPLENGTSALNSIIFNGGLPIELNKDYIKKILSCLKYMIVEIDSVQTY